MTSPFSDLLDAPAHPGLILADEHCAAFHAPEPLRPGHVLVVPRAEVDHWIDLPPELAAHLFQVARVVAQGIQLALSPTKVGLMIAGIKVRHVHLHLIPIRRVADLLEADVPMGPVDGPAAAAAIRRVLRGSGGKGMSGADTPGGRA